jgi:ATP-dependent DNA helicase RecG
METIFLSSVQGELAEHRRAVRAFVEGDPLLRRFFRVFLFEDIPAADRRPDQVYLEKVATSALYVGLFGRDYGFEDAEGVSPTEREFDEATRLQRPRLVYLIGDGTGRHPKMAALIARVAPQLIRRRVGTLPELTAALYASLIARLEQTGAIRTLPFDAAACPRATLDDLDPDKLHAFLTRAREQRGYAVLPGTALEPALVALHLLDGGQPSHAAVLLFGREPQRFLPSSEVKCLHYHGTEVRKPIPSYQLYKGTVFAVIDQALDFVLSKLDRAVGTRTGGAAAPVTYEIPPAAVAEALANAVAHRDYASAASVQVMLFSDRLEIWNPGELPAALSLEALTRLHPSLPRNPLLAEPLFLARYIEKVGSGIVDMIALCVEAGLTRPAFRQDGGFFVQTLWRPVTPQATPQDNPLVQNPLAVLAGVLGLSTPQATPQAAQQVAALLRAAQDDAQPRETLQTASGLADREHFRQAYLEPLLNAGWLERTLPEKRTSPHQRYRLAAAARTWLHAYTLPSA